MKTKEKKQRPKKMDLNPNDPCITCDYCNVDMKVNCSLYRKFIGERTEPTHHAELPYIESTDSSKVDAMMDLAFHYIGTPYIWGGDDPFGFDCSGFVIELLKSVGVLPRRGDWTAQSLYTYLVHRGFEVPPLVPFRGCLVFYERMGRIFHVEMCYDDCFSIGASGGNSTTITLEKARMQNAFVKMRPINNRKEHKLFINPFLG